MLAELKKHAMTAISFLIPVVVAAGFLLAIGSIGGGITITDFSKNFHLFDAFSTMGSLGLGLLPVVISAGISFSIADKPGIAPGVIIGLVSKAIGAGFFGGFIGGYIAGYVTKFVVKKLKVPYWAEGLKPMLIIPLISSAICGLLMFFVIGIPVRSGTIILENYLENLSGSSKFIYGMVIGVLSAVDYGGAINKVVYAFVLGLLSQGVKEPVTVLMIASMVTPFGMTMAYFIQKIFRKNIYKREEVENLKVAFPMGICMITEGCLPIVMNDVVRCVIATGVGGAIGGGFSMLWGADSAVPHGGLFAIVTMHHPLAFLLSLFIGSLATAIVLVIFKRPVDINSSDPEGDTEEADISDSSIKIS
ncbi:MAG: PTS fructose transporter subunit IIC [Clostridium sp.]|jgi:PTS system fructose-specific IIC component|uniref:PTS fructose transporter subunit IIC n=1 Tax=Clostridium sp. TaxID=1506 RepID=UPI0025BE900B|nr:PTS fructose transporter subunit IIC [Clostridium sp.]MCH3964845.1 PTS fructose transporter subunit IIC [Clostridium sp.]MCI1716660.1 PTS fructose transporter subunit IIC [Clostridium sp.]MCI1800858.1 PTS fructose transporter subunit IIC [Clostridium sp.]MCI1814837.1 PTS fructose transporter subunit IIC [Clostridium sp.]MCI1871605.1 PTS fructose transporter subunit IIC [Clostridium sp.]